MDKAPYNKDFEEMKRDMWSHPNSSYDETHKTMKSVTYGRKLTKHTNKSHED